MVRMYIENLIPVFILEIYQNYQFNRSLDLQVSQTGYNLPSWLVNLVRNMEALFGRIHPYANFYIM